MAIDISMVGERGKQFLRPIRGLFDADIEVWAAPIGMWGDEVLGPRERMGIERAVPRRRAEFATARGLAKWMMRRMGWPEQEIPVGPDRVPKWPEGLTGSISHSKEWALVAITTEANGRVGIDVEHREQLEEPLWEMVFTDAEVARWKGLSREEQLRCALIGFCAKEAVYKAQYGWTGSFLGFHAVEVELSGCADRVGDFSCTFRQDVRPSKFDGGRAFRAGERVGVRYLLDWLRGAPVIVGAWIKG